MSQQLDNLTIAAINLLSSTNINKSILYSAANEVKSLATSLTGVSGATTRDLSNSEVTSTIIDNIGQTAPCFLQLPVAQANMNFIMMVGEANSFYWKVKASAGNKLYLNGTPGNLGGYVGITVPTVSAFISAFTFKTGPNAYNYEWYVSAGNGIWSAS